MYLEEIIESKKQECELLGAIVDLEHKCDSYKRNVLKTQWSESLDVIAEIKRKSPSKGELATIDNPDQLAQVYADSDASMISVLTDVKYFGAKDDDFFAVRNTVELPLLRKDFIIDQRQVCQSYLMDADVILLIVSAFNDHGLMKSLYEQAKSYGLEVLVETHDSQEIERAYGLGAKLIGVNSRDLNTFKEQPDLAQSMMKSMPDDTIKVWESSIRSLDDAKRAKESGADAVLIGQALVQNDDPGHFISQIKAL